MKNETKSIVRAAAGGSLLHLTATEARSLISKMAASSQYDTKTRKVNLASSTNSETMEETINNLITKKLEMVLKNYEERDEEVRNVWS